MSAASSAFSTTLTAAPLICTGRLLDSMPRSGTPIALAFSTRKVATSYRGPCMRVRRTSDNREEDIGFVQTDLDWESLLTFASGFDCFVSAWYDQSGQGRHATQTDPLLQPQIVRNGKVVMDTNSNQISLRFNGAFLRTSWAPQATDVAEGVGMLASASIGLDEKSLQSGTAAVTSRLPVGMTVTTEYPSPLLPEGHDLYLLEGMNVQPTSLAAQVVYTSGGRLTHLNVNAEQTGYDGSSQSGVFTPSGPAVVTVDTLKTGTTETNSQWRRGINLGGRIFAIPSSSDQVLEIKYALGVVGDRIVRHALPTQIVKTDANKFWMGVAVTANVGYCIPARAEFVLKIDATDPLTPIFTHLGTGLARTTSLDNGRTLDNKWHDAVFLGGKVWAVPHNAAQMLTIDPVTDTVAFAPGPTNALSFGLGLFSSAVASGDKVVGVPWNAACFLVANTSLTTNNITLEGTTGLTPFISGHGSGYIAPPVITVSPPGNGGVPLELQCAIAKTRSAMSVTVTDQGTGYTSSPTVSWYSNGSYYYGSLPSSPKPGVAVSGIAATMAPVDEANLQLGYKITGIRLTSGGTNLPATDAGGKPIVQISGGKGAAARAQAVVAERKVILINVASAGSGYTTVPSVTIVGGGGTGAVATASGLTPIVYATNPVTGEITSTGGSIVSITVTSVGSGYKSTPEVRIGATTTGKGTNATAIPELVVDGQVAGVTPSPGGSGYAMETATPVNPMIVISPPARPGGVQARAYISEVDPITNAITKITVTNVGSGYTASQPIGVTVRTGVAGQGSGASATAAYEDDGWLTRSLTITQQGTKYTTRPTVTVTGGFGPRNAVTGGTSSTPTGPASIGSVTVWLEGTTTLKPSPYVYNNQPDGTQKFRATFVPDPTGDRPSPPVYCFPYWTNRVLKFETAGSAFTCTDLYPKKTDPLTDLPVDDTTALGRAPAQHEAGVAVRKTGPSDPTQEAFYAIPYFGRKQIVKFTETTGVTILPKLYNGNWNQGVLAPINKNIYCVPANNNALLVIDTKQESKSEMVSFSNVRGNKGNKWWGAVMAGGVPSPANPVPPDNLIFGIPGDVDVVLEINPGVPLRRKTLPAPGVVLPDKRHILFTPSLQNDGSRTLLKYDTLTKMEASPVGTFTAPQTANVSYAEGVTLPDGNVIFVPTYNQTDPFVYTGNVGIFNTNTNEFTYSATTVPIDQAAPFPSRTATALGGSPLVSKLVSWVPRETTAAMMTYDHSSKPGYDANPADRIVAKGTRSQSRVDAAAAVLVGDPESSQRVLVAQPSPTQAIITTTPNYGSSWPAARFGGAALTRQNVVVLAPGGEFNHVVLFYPDRPDQTLNVVPGTGVFFPTRMEPSPDIVADFQTLGQKTKFGGAIYNGIDQKVYCVPLYYWRVMVIDPVNNSISDFGDLSQDAGPVTDPGGNALYWGGCQGADGKLYFTPHDARRIMVVDPTVENPTARISYIDLPPGLSTSGTAKWRGAALANDGRIFCAPYSATTVLIIDPATKTSAVVGSGLTWLTTGNGKFCDVVVGADKNMYFMPARSPYIIGIDPAQTTASDGLEEVLVLDTKVGGHTLQNDRWGGACAAPNGRLYAAPYAYSEILEYDIRTNVLERFGGSSAYFANSNSDYGRWQAILPGRNGNVYAFPYYWNTILTIETEQTRAYMWNNQGSPSWLTTQAMDGPYRLRPFLLSDGDTAVFHTSGRSSLVLYNVADVNANTTPIIGPGVQEGIAAHFPAAADRILVANVGTLVTVTPFEGGLGGVKSYTGNADLFLGTSGADLTLAVGNASVGIRNVLETLLKDGVPGVYAAYGTAATKNLDLYLRDVPLGGTTYGWQGESGNTFSVGVVQGSEVQTAEFSAPSYRSGFNGLISELVVFQSDQSGRARALGESPAFYYLDSKLPITQ